MGNTTDKFQVDGNTDPRQICRVAYSINNYQPVICTIISEQPLFYMDEDDTYEDDDLLLDEELISLDRDIQALKRKVEAYDRLSLEFSQPADTRAREFLSDSLYVCEQQNKYEQNIDTLLNTLSKSRMAEALIAEAQAYHVVLRYSEQVFTAQYDVHNHAIYVNPTLSLPDQCLCASRELRRHWQHRNGVMINPLSFQPDHAILVNRAQMADLNIFMVRIAWELQLSGIKAVWERIENSELSDLGRTLAREAYVDFRTLNNGQAMSAVFETWFLSERSKIADKGIIQNMLADYEGLVFDADSISRSVTIELITNLGTVPFGKNYLAPYAQLITNDPIFTDVRDRANANFLWFIKFEQSFRETEKELQGNSAFTSGSLKNDDNNAQPSIVSFPKSHKNAQIAELNGQDAETENVIFVQFC